MQEISKILADKYEEVVEKINSFSNEYLNEEYEANNNNVKMWESSIEDMNKFKSTHEAYTAYLMYCTYNRYKPVSAGKFNQEMVRIQRKTKE